MAGSRAEAIEETGILPEDELRASQYRLLARFLAKPPDAGLLTLVSGFSGDETELGKALALLARLARKSSPEKASEEYHELFIGMGRGELLPYGSYYQTGFLNEKPLAELRRSMGEIGIARSEGTSEPEDHIAALCDMMAGLIMGDFGEPQSLAEQKRFFDHHMASWSGQFFSDLETAKGAMLYTPIGTLGRVFMEIEATAFEMAS
jgi:TorA maturation chaperone TorD